AIYTIQRLYDVRAIRVKPQVHSFLHRHDGKITKDVLFALTRQFILCGNPLDISQSWRRGLERSVPGVRAFNLQLAFIDLVDASGEERIAVFASESQIGDSAVRSRNDRVHAAGLIANLDAHARRNIQPPVAINAHAVGLTAVNRIGYVQPVILLLVLE